MPQLSLIPLIAHAVAAAETRVEESWQSSWLGLVALLLWTGVVILGHNRGGSRH